MRVQTMKPGLICASLALAVAMLLSNGRAKADIQAGGPSNIVIINNVVDGAFSLRGQVHITELGGPVVAPVNIALATSSCTGCDSLAVALQLILYQQGAPYFAPQNAAAATNAGCSNCVTVADACQAVLPLADRTVIPTDVRQEIQQANQELNSLQAQAAQGLLSVSTALDSLNNQVIPEFSGVVAAYGGTIDCRVGLPSSASS